MPLRNGTTTNCYLFDTVRFATLPTRFQSVPSNISSHTLYSSTAPHFISHTVQQYSTAFHLTHCTAVQHCISSHTLYSSTAPHFTQSTNAALQPVYMLPNKPLIIGQRHSSPPFWSSKERAVSSVSCLHMSVRPSVSPHAIKCGHQPHSSVTTTRHWRSSHLLAF